jgi:soluble P-type ATPase
MEVRIPGFGVLQLDYVVLDYNGTLACEGTLIAGVAEKLASLRSKLDVHVLTGDTFAKVRTQLAGLPWVELVVLEPAAQAEAKRDYVEKLGSSRTVCIGNGRNDRLMLEIAALAIVVVQSEGAAGVVLEAADIVCRDILEALDLLILPRRLLATLRA